jgi:hypothetical protein
MALQSMPLFLALSILYKIGPEIILSNSKDHIVGDGTTESTAKILCHTHAIPMPVALAARSSQLCCLLENDNSMMKHHGLIDDTCQDSYGFNILADFAIRRKGKLMATASAAWR